MKHTAGKALHPKKIQPALGRSISKVLLTTVLLTMSLSAGGCSTTWWRSTPSDTRTLDAMQRASNVQSFDEVWAKVDATYFKPERLAAGPGNVNWAAAKAELRPLVERTTTQRDARTVTTALLDRLGETHFNIIPAERYSEPSFTRTDYRELGADVRLLGNDAVVARVTKNSPCSSVGVQRGWTLQRIGDENVPNLIRKVRAAFQGSKFADVWAQRRVQDLMVVRPGQEARLTFLDGEGKQQQMLLRGTAAPRENLTRLGDLPAMSLRVETETSTDNVGYFSLSSFLDPPTVMPAFDAFIRAHERAPGIIIDLRGNPGGLSGMASGLAGHLIEQEGATLGSMVTREGRLNLTINPRLPTYRGKVAILLDRLSMSTSEMFAAGLRDLGRARIFGEQTPGAALPSTVTRLSNGDRFQFAVADFVRTTGERLEGVGIRPDEPLPLHREDLLAGRDAAVDAALVWIRSAAAAPATMPAAASPPAPEASHP